MNFNQLSYWPGLLLILLVFVVLVLLLEKRFFSFIKTYWFYNRSWFSYISSFLFIIGMTGLLFSLLDPRGPEERIKAEVPSDRTIILIDTSASMLAEDVKPSRLQKAVLIAKHFARKAAGHQLSIVVFAEIQKKIVPFTNDIDLIDARLDSIKNLRNQYGSSALTHAIQESIQYFRETGGEAQGNILVLTDGEETSESIDLKIPAGIHVALVGVGTEQGGRIPLDDGRGFRFGYKKDRGRDITTKLNEKYFKQIVSDIPSGKYWVANTYSLPSEEILSFFQAEKVKSNDQQDMVIKPVLMEWIVVPSLLLLILSYFFKAIKVFSLGLLLIIAPSFAQEEQDSPKLSPEVVEQLERLQQGKLTQLERIKLADDLHRSGAKPEALELYQENLNPKVDKDVPAEAYLNYGTALLEKGDIRGGLDVYQKLNESMDESQHSQKIRETMDRNVVSAFQLQEQKKKEEQEKKDQEKKDQNKKESGSQGQSEPKSGEQNKDQDKSDGQNKDEEKKESGEQKDKEKNEPNDESEDQDKKNKDQANEGEEQKPMPPKKIPAKLKQLMSDDRQLQIKMIENGTKDLNKRKSRKSKDW